MPKIMHYFPQETVPKGGKCLFQTIYLQTLLSFAAEMDHCESLDNSILHPEQKENSILKVVFFSKVNTRICKSISFSMDVFSSIAVFCVLIISWHLFHLRKFLNASMIAESKKQIIHIVALSVFYGGRGGYLSVSVIMVRTSPIVSGRSLQSLVSS